MSFGQTSGPPATAAQLAELVELFAAVGFDGFREARHPYGLSQRQSNGKFTRTEADQLIERLRAEVDGVALDQSGAAVAPATSQPVRDEPVRDEPVPVDELPAVDDVVLAFPDEVLADELRRRGWACIPPTPEVS